MPRAGIPFTLYGTLVDLGATQTLFKGGIRILKPGGWKRSYVSFGFPMYPEGLMSGTNAVVVKAARAGGERGSGREALLPWGRLPRSAQRD